MRPDDLPPGWAQTGPSACDRCVQLRDLLTLASKELSCAREAAEAAGNLWLADDLEHLLARITRALETP